MKSDQPVGLSARHHLVRGFTWSQVPKAPAQHHILQSLRPLGLALLLVLSATSASAATIVADGISCTLAQAITAANTNASAGGCQAGDDRNGGGDIIELTNDVLLTVVDNYDAGACPNGLPAVTSIIRIKGNRHTITRAVGSDRPWFRILDSTAGNLTLQDVTVSNGFMEACDGAGINGTVTLINSTVSHNYIYSGGGAGINGTATLFNSFVTGNIVSWGNGGGIKGDAALYDSTVSGNCAGGCVPPSLAAPSTSLAALSTSTLDFAPYSYPTGEGGGIAGGTITLFNSVVSANTAGVGNHAGGGGLAIYGTATIINSSVSDNVAWTDSGFGGGIYLYSGVATLVNSTVSGNVARGTQSGLTGAGGGIFSGGISWLRVPGGPVTLVHSTVSNNRATSYYLPQFDQGEGGGIYGERVTVLNTIIADNSAGTPTDADCSATNVQFQGVNFVGDGSCGATSSGQLTGDPRLGLFAGYGGPTPVQPPLAGSPLLDQIAFTAGTGCGGATVTTDQRGVPRPQPADGNCDIGAIEYTGFPTNAVLDNFNRADGKVGPNWSGDAKLASYRIVDAQVRVRDGGPMYWAPAVFGSDQEAYVTLTKIDPNGSEHDLLLKVQGDPASYTLGEIELLYDARQRVVRVETLLPGRSTWTKYQDIPVTFEDGDQFGGRVYATGEVQIYRNNVLLATVTLKARDQQFFNQNGGRIGVWFDAAPKAIFDSFGGGTVTR